MAITINNELTMTPNEWYIELKEITGEIVSAMSEASQEYCQWAATAGEEARRAESQYQTMVTILTRKTQQLAKNLVVFRKFCKKGKTMACGV